MVTREDILRRRVEILEIASRYGAHDVRLVGSVARGDQDEKSDVDFLVGFERGRSLFDHGGLVMDLRDLLGMRVDVIDEDALDERFRSHVLPGAVAL